MTDPDDDLPALRAPTTGRRSDDAFARSVAADVSAARKRWSPLWLGLPSLAGAAAVVVLVGGPSLRAPRGPDARGMLLEARGTGVHVRFAGPVTIPAEGVRSLLSLRPEKLTVLAGNETADNVVHGTIRAWSYLGAGFSLVVATEHLGEIRAVLPAWNSAVAPAEGLPVRLGWAADAAVPVIEDVA